MHLINLFLCLVLFGPGVQTPGDTQVPHMKCQGYKQRGKAGPVAKRRLSNPQEQNETTKQHTPVLSFCPRL